MQRLLHYKEFIEHCAQEIFEKGINIDNLSIEELGKILSQYFIKATVLHENVRGKIFSNYRVFKPQGELNNLFKKNLSRHRDYLSYLPDVETLIVAEKLFLCLDKEIDVKPLPNLMIDELHQKLSFQRLMESISWERIENGGLVTQKEKCISNYIQIINKIKEMLSLDASEEKRLKGIQLLQEIQSFINCNPEVQIEATHSLLRRP